MLCHRCGTHVPDGAGECGNCGQRFVSGGIDKARLTGSFETLKRRKGAQADRDREKRRDLTPAGAAAPELAKDRLRPGELVARRYEIRSEIGRGPAGAVYRALDQEIDDDVALKVIAPAVLPTDADKERFVRVLRKARRLSQQNIVRVYDVDWEKAEDRVFYTSQYLEGLTLRKILDLRRDRGQFFELREVEPIVSQVCLALQHAHRSSVHGGLKPSNIVILPDLLKITDFYVAEALGPDVFLRLQDAAEVGAYVAREVREGRPADARSDLFSLGAMLTEMLCGAPRLADGERPSARNPLLRAAEDELYERASAADPEGRYRSAEEFSEDVTSVIDTGGVIRGEDLGEGATAGGAAVGLHLEGGTLLDESDPATGYTDHNVIIEEIRPAADDEPSPGADLFGTADEPDGGAVDEAAPGRSPEGGAAGATGGGEATAEQGDGAGADAPTPAPPGDGAGAAAAAATASPEPVLFDDSARRRLAAQEGTPEERAALHRAVPTQELRYLPPGAPPAARDKERLNLAPVALLILVVVTCLAYGAIQLLKPPGPGGQVLSVADPVGPGSAAAPDPRSPEGQAATDETGTGGAVVSAATVPPAAAPPTLAAPLPEPPPPAVAPTPAAGAAAGLPAPPLPPPAPALVAAAGGVAGPVAGRPTAGAPRAAQRADLEPLIPPAPDEPPPPLAPPPRQQPPPRPPPAPAAAARPEPPRAPAPPARPAASAPAPPRAAVAPTPPAPPPPPRPVPPPPPIEVRPPPPPPRQPAAPAFAVASVAPPPPAPGPGVSPAGAAPGPGRLTKCPAGMAKIKKGKAQIGSSKADSYRGFEGVEQRVETDAYCIDAHEYPGAGRPPLTGVSHAQAEALCGARSLRLCADSEWERACKGPAGSRYPYGNDFRADKCVTEDTGEQPRTLQAAGSFKGCKSGYGVYDMSGNAAEWSAEGHLRGGSSEKPDYAVRCAHVVKKNKGAKDPAVGFRCCADAQ